MNPLTWIILFLICPPFAIIIFWGKTVKKQLKLLVWVYAISYFLLIVSFWRNISNMTYEELEEYLKYKEQEERQAAIMWSTGKKDYEIQKNRINRS
jgi:hypothetical protein